MSSEVIILQEGYGYRDENGKDRATGSSTLIKGKYTIIVDTGGPWEKQKLLDKLKEHDVIPEDIDIVVGTHGHSDHVGNLNLFPHAKQIVGFDINVGDMFEDNSFKDGAMYTLVEGEIEVIPTPGHTHSDVSVVVHNAVGYGIVGVVGDLFECENDNGVWQAVSECIEVQESNRKKLLDLCDYIIPGHGAIFKVKKEDYL